MIKGVIDAHLGPIRYHSELQMSPIHQTTFLVGTFFDVSYSKPALPQLHNMELFHLLWQSLEWQKLTIGWIAPNRKFILTKLSRMLNFFLLHIGLCSFAHNIYLFIENWIIFKICYSLIDPRIFYHKMHYCKKSIEKVLIAIITS